MSKTNGSTPGGYGHDAKGAAGGSTKGDGKPGVAHTAPADKVAGEGHGPKTITFTLDGEEVHARDGRDHLAGRQAQRHRHSASVLRARARLSPGRQLPRLHGRDRRRARAGGKLHPHADCRHEGEVGLRPRQDRAKDGVRAVDLGSARPQHAGARSGVEVLELGRPDRDRVEPPAGAREKSRARPQPRRDGGQSRRLHPVQSLRPRLPRSAGQRRDRHGGARPQRKDRVRLRRSDGSVDLRCLRRMRAGLPDRRADAVDPGERG